MGLIHERKNVYEENRIDPIHEIGLIGIKSAMFAITAEADEQHRSGLAEWFRGFIRRLVT